MMLIEFQAFQELFHDLENYKNLFLKKLKKKSDIEKNLKNYPEKRVKYEKELEIEKKNLDDLEKICEILQMIIREREIPKITNTKKLEYREVLNKLAKNKLKVVRTKIEFWDNIKKVSGDVVSKNC